MGYAPYDLTLSRPGDRRRFPHYARLRGLDFEIADPGEDYDLVVISGGADISRWARYRGRAKVIYELINAYIALSGTDARSAVRGIAKFATRQNHHLLLDYRRGIEQMCRRADAVVCTTEEISHRVRNLCKNAPVVLDFQDQDITRVKESYAAGSEFKIVWEGMPENLQFLRTISGALDDLRSKRPLAIHAITDLEYGRYLGWRFGKTQTLKEVGRIWPGVYLYQWNRSLFSTIVTACDLAIVPVPLDDPLSAGKPENKLLLFWRMAMPTVASATASYRSAMERAGLVDMACTTSDQWKHVLSRYMSNEDLRRAAGRRGYDYVNEHYSEQRLAEKWDDVIASVFSNG